MSPLTRSLRLLAWRPAGILAGGLALAVLTETSSVALVALSGWFITSCYLSGINPLSTFSYLNASGGVRAFAVTRIGSRYAERLVLHTATLRWLARLRVQMFVDASAAGPDRLRRLRSGQALDRTMNDAETVDGVLIRSVAPVVVAVLATAGGVAVVSSFSVTAGVTLLVAVAGVATVAAGADRCRGPAAPATSAAARGAARSEVIAAVDAWEEMVCLGAVGQLRSAAAAALSELQGVGRTAADDRSRAQLAVDCGAGIGVAAVLAGCVLSTPSLHLQDTALIVLLTTGVLDLVAVLPRALRSWRDAGEAAARVADLAAPDTGGPDGSVGRSGRADRNTTHSGPPTGLDVVARQLALDPQATCVVPELDVVAGDFLVVTGRSGAGKTTLLRALAGETASGEAVVLVGGRLPQAFPAGRIVLVPHDDYIFSGSVATNLQLAAPDIGDGQVEALMSAMGLSAAGITAHTLVGAGGRALSGGESRRLCLARAVASEPGLLLIDEPTEGLDAPTARAVLSSLRELLPTTTIVAAIHVKDDAEPPGLRHLDLDAAAAALSWT